MNWLDKFLLKFFGALDTICEGIERLCIYEPKKRKGKKDGKDKKSTKR